MFTPLVFLVIFTVLIILTVVSAVTVRGFNSCSKYRINSPESHNWKGSHGKSVSAFFKGAENMVGKIIFGVAVILTFGLYCCVRVGGQADRQMEEMRKKKRKDQENGESG